MRNARIISSAAAGLYLGPERERGGREEIGEIFFLNHSFKLHKLSPNYSLSF